MSAGGPPARVLLLCGYGGPYAGSFVPMLRAIAAEARGRGLEVECGFTPIARDRAWLEDLAADGIEVRFAPGDDRGELRDWVAARLEELSGPALIHTHFTSFEVAAVSAARSAGPAPVLWHVHSHQPRAAAMIARAVVKYAWFGRRVAAIVCVSEAIERAVRRRGAPRKRVQVVANGIDVERFRAIDSDERERARTRLGIAADALALLHIGWDWEAKGGPLFAATVAGARAAGIDAVGVSVGGGAAARAAAAELGLGDALRAVEPDPDVRRLYSAADVLLATSHGEGAPFAILEALSCGLAVVATDVPGHQLGLEPPSALRLASGGADGLCEAVAAVAGRSAAAGGAEASDAHAWVVANRSLATTASLVVDLYESALADR